MEGRPGLLRDITNMRVPLTSGDRFAIDRAIGRLAGAAYQAIGVCPCSPGLCDRCRILSEALGELEAQD